MATSARTTTRDPVSRFTALPGCYIFVLLGCMALGLVIWAGYTFTSQARQLEKFTDAKAVTLPVRQPAEGEISALRDKLTGFRDSADAGQAASVSLTVDE